MRQASSVVVGVGMLLLCAGTTLAQSMSERVKDAIQSYTEAAASVPPADRAAREKLAKDALAEVDFTQLSPAEFRDLNRSNLVALSGRTAEMRTRLESMLSDRTSTGAEASAMLAMTGIKPTWRLEKGSEEYKAAVTEQRTLASQVLDHPAVADAFAAGKLEGMLSMFAGLDESVVPDLVPKLAKLGSVINDGVPLSVVRELRPFVELVASNADKVDAKDLDLLRRRAVSATDAAMTAASASDPRMASSLKRSIDFFNGALARGQLVNHTAPNVEFIWSNYQRVHGSETPLRTLADLKGKVVVIDFWATWCGPCIASFPEVRKLQEHYKGYPVVVLGVTSLQGSHYGRGEDPNARPTKTDTAGDAAKELALMDEFVTQMDMTWPVAFSKQDVFNPDFGVMGIPHVAIVDPAGKVRFRGLHPSGTPWSEKLDMIDGLLKEANLPVPARQAEETKTGG